MPPYADSQALHFQRLAYQVASNLTPRIWLRRIHERVVERILAPFEAHPTAGCTRLKELDIDSENAVQGVDYAPTPRLIIRWVHAHLPKDLNDWTFVDIGAGRGRVMIEAAQNNYAKVIGVEFAPELHAEAEKNIAVMDRSRQCAGSLQLRLGDATRIDVPNGPCVFYLFNPFGASVLEAFLAGVLDAHRADPRPMIFIYINPLCAATFTRFPRLKQWRPPLAARIKFTLFSPYAINIFATVEGLCHLRD